MRKELVDRIKSVPPLPKTFIEISEIYKNPKGTISQLSKIVEKDPMLIANILKIVNSPLYGLRREIKTVSQAVSLLGMKEVYAISASASVKKLLKVDMEPYGIEPEKFAILSNMQGSLVKNWLGKDREKSDTLFMPTLLQETGKIIIADEVALNDEVYQFKSEIENTANVANVEKMFVDVTSAEVTAEIFEHWGFDDFVVNIIRFSDDYSNAPQEYREYAVYLKVVKTAVAINAPLSERSVKIACNILEKEDMDINNFLTAVQKIKKSYEGEF